MSTAAEHTLQQLLDTAGLPVRDSYSIEEVARLLSVAPSSVVRKCTAGELEPSGRGRSRRIPRRALADWLEASRAGAEAKASTQTEFTP